MSPKQFRGFPRKLNTACVLTSRDFVIDPLAEAIGALDARLRELNKENPLAPIGRDPVPDRYSEVVRRYFEELGK